MSIRIGIDLMGGDAKPEDIYKSIVSYFQNAKQSIHFVFFAKETLRSFFEKSKKDLTNSNTSIEIHYTEHFISMDEDPLFAFRRKKDSTMFVGMHRLKEDKIDAFISCGNTGALMTSAKMIIGTYKNILRPALLAMIPTKTNLTAILDVGAGISFKSENLVQFALMGTAFQKAKKIKKPNIALLNIGVEEKKGTSVHQKAYKELMKLKDDFNFIGNIESREVFEGKADVIVTDGFTGNIFLKTAEGIASFVLDKIYENLSTKELKGIENIFNSLKKRLYYGEYPGALLIGIKKTIIKCYFFNVLYNI